MKIKTLMLISSFILVNAIALYAVITPDFKQIRKKKIKTINRITENIATPTVDLASSTAITATPTADVATESEEIQ